MWESIQGVLRPPNVPASPDPIAETNPTGTDGAGDVWSLRSDFRDFAAFGQSFEVSPRSNPRMPS